MKDHLTPEDIDSCIVDIQTGKIGKKTCVVCVTLKNGFEITESASCVNSDNYDEKIGQQIALQRCKDKIWMLEGYKLQEMLASKCCSEGVATNCCNGSTTEGASAA